MALTSARELQETLFLFVLSFFISSIQEHFDAITRLRELLAEHHAGEEVGVAEAAFRWIYNHSALDGDKGDAVILGSSRLTQLETNLTLAGKGPLAAPVVEFMEDWWQSTKHLCPNYFR